MHRPQPPQAKVIFYDKQNSLTSVYAQKFIVLKESLSSTGFICLVLNSSEHHLLSRFSFTNVNSSSHKHGFKYLLSQSFVSQTYLSQLFCDVTIFCVSNTFVAIILCHNYFCHKYICCNFYVSQTYFLSHTQHQK